MNSPLDIQYLQDGHICKVILRNPPANAISSHVKDAFEKLLSELSSLDSLHVLIITGTGNKFCVGDDLSEAKSRLDDPDATQANLFRFGKIMQDIHDLPFVTIAAVNGWCLGGGLELALACDIRIASEEAKFKAVAVNVGLTASAIKLPMVIGLGAAKHMLFTADEVNASRAYELGLVTAVHPTSELENNALALAQNIASKAPLAIRATKRILRKAHATSNPAIINQAQLELIELSKSSDYKRAIQAFSEKRAPDFKGN